MKITNLLSQSKLQTKKAVQEPNQEKARASQRRASEQAPQSEAVKLSPSLQQPNSDSSHTQKLERIKQQVDAGTYSSDSRSVAAALLGL